MRSYNEFTQGNPLAISPADKTTVKQLTIQYLQNMRKQFPSQIAFQNALKYSTNIISGQDPQSKNIIMSMMSQPVSVGGMQQAPQV